MGKDPNKWARTRASGQKLEHGRHTRTGAEDPNSQQFSREDADEWNVTSASKPAAPIDPRIAEALRLPRTRWAAGRSRFSDVRNRRDRRKVGTAVFDRFRISLPWDDKVGLG